MATRDDVRRISMSFPGVNESSEGFAFSVTVKGKEKGFVWAWKERVTPKKPKTPHPTVVAVLVPGLAAKELLLASSPDKYFTEPHYNGFPAVLLHLEAVPVDELEDLLVEAWRCKATKELVSQLPR